MPEAGGDKVCSRRGGRRVPSWGLVRHPGQVGSITVSQSLACRTPLPHPTPICREALHTSQPKCLHACETPSTRSGHAPLPRGGSATSRPVTRRARPRLPVAPRAGNCAVFRCISCDHERHQVGEPACSVEPLGVGVGRVAYKEVPPLVVGWRSLPASSSSSRACTPPVIGRYHSSVRDKAHHPATRNGSGLG